MLIPFPSSIQIWKDDAKFKAASESFSRDTAKLWNNAPIKIKNAPNLSCAKREIKKNIVDHLKSNRVYNFFDRQSYY